MIACEVCEWKDDAPSAPVSNCPCCGFCLKAAPAARAAAAPLAEREEQRAWSVGPAGGRLPEGAAVAAAAGRLAVRYWWRTHAAAAAVTIIAVGGVAVAGRAALRRLDAEPAPHPATVGTALIAVENTPPAAAPEASTPPAEVVRRELERYLTAGLSVDGDPTLVHSGGGADEYRVTLRATGGLFRVRVRDLRLPSDAPSLLRQLADRLRLEPRLPPGKEYELEAPETVLAAGGTVEAVWRATWTRTVEGWRLASADPVRTDPGAGSGGGGALLTVDEVDAARERRDATLAGYAERCRAVERETEAYRAEVMANAPPACAAETAPLLQQVVRLTAECPRVADPDAREECFARRDVLNRKFGACEAQDEERERALAAAGRRAEEFRRQRVASLAAELER